MSCLNIALVLLTKWILMAMTIYWYVVVCSRKWLCSWCWISSLSWIAGDDDVVCRLHSHHRLFNRNTYRRLNSWQWASAIFNYQLNYQLILYWLVLNLCTGYQRNVSLHFGFLNLVWQTWCLLMFHKFRNYKLCCSYQTLTSLFCNIIAMLFGINNIEITAHQNNKHISASIQSKPNKN